MLPRIPRIRGVQIYSRVFKSRKDYICGSTQRIPLTLYHQFVKLYPDGEDQRSPVMVGNATTADAQKWFREHNIPF